MDPQGGGLVNLTGPGDGAADQPVDERARPHIADRTENPGLFMWSALVFGWAVVIFGLHGILSNSESSNPEALFRILIGLNLINDVLIAPVLIALAVVLRRLLPRWLLVPVDVGLILTAVVTLYAYPLVGSWGKTARAGASRLPWNYAHNLALVLLVVWASCALGAVVSWQRTRTKRS
jgi:hypothetical protein